MAWVLLHGIAGRALGHFLVVVRYILGYIRTLQAWAVTALQRNRIRIERAILVCESMVCQENIAARQADIGKILSPAAGGEAQWEGKRVLHPPLHLGDLQ